MNRTENVPIPICLTSEGDDPMNPKRRMEYIMTALAVGVIGITALFSYGILTGKTAAIEKDELRSHGKAITKYFVRELDTMDKIVRDYARWDDTLNYHRQGSEDYAEETFQPEVFENLQISHMLFLDGHARIRTAYSALRTPGVIEPLAAADVQAFNEKYGGILRENLANDKDIKGIVLLEGRPCLMAVTAITDTAGTVTDGAMALVRPLGQDTLLWIQDILDCSAAFSKPASGVAYEPTVPDEHLHVTMGEFTSHKGGATARLNLGDILWDPVLGIVITSTSQLRTLGRQILTMIMILSLTSVFAIYLLQTWLNNTLILAPIRTLGQSLTGISDYAKLQEFSVFPDRMLLREDATVVGRIHGLLRRISEDALKLQRERLSTRMALDSSMAGTWEYDVKTGAVRGDVQTLHLLGLGAEAGILLKEALIERVSPDHRQGVRKLFQEYTGNQDGGFEMEFQIADNDGIYHWRLIKGDGLEWDRDGQCMLFSGILLDIDQKKRMEAELVQLSYHDKLTGLFNRRYFEEKLKAFDQPENLPVTIFVADINGLKLANDAFGHERGDKLLKQAAICLQNAAGGGAVISRWGGDEFAILLPCTSELQAQEIFNKIKTGCLERGSRGMALHLAVGYSVKKWGALSLQHVVRSAEEKMYRDKLLESRNAHADFLEKFKNLLHEKGIETFEHCQRVASLSSAVGVRLNLNRNMMEELVLLGDLHDIGKIALPEDLFVKTGALTEMEWAIIHSHPEIGFRIIALMQDYAHLAQAVLSHHEWYNGAGYPRGLKDQEIPLVSRIVTLADAVDIMLSGTVYRLRMDQDAVIAELRKMQGVQFDPVLVDHMIDILVQGAAAALYTP